MAQGRFRSIPSHTPSFCTPQGTYLHQPASNAQSTSVISGCCTLLFTGLQAELSDILRHSCGAPGSHEVFLELAYNKCSVFKKRKRCSHPNMMLNALTAIFQEHSCTCPAQILPLTPTAEFCASLTHNSTTFGILEIGLSMTINIFHQYLAKSWPFAGTLVCLPF